MTQLDWPAESTAYLGYAAGLIRVPLVTSNGATPGISESRNDNLTTKTTVTGRVYAQRPELSRREWEVSLTELPSYLYAPLAAAFSDGVAKSVQSWITPHMAVTNLVTPDETSPMLTSGALLDGVIQDSETGMVIPSAWRTGLDSDGSPLPAVLATAVPLAPDGRGAVASAYVWSMAGQGPATLHADYYRDTTYVSTASQDIQNEDGGRVVLYLDAIPQDATQVNLRIEGAFRVGAPQLTWTPEVTPYFPGRGCRNAIVTGFQEVDALIDHDGSWMSCEFTVKEVG